MNLSQKMQNGYDSMTVMTVCEITTTETQTKPKNASHCHKPHCHNAYDSVAAQCPEGKAYAMKAKPMPVPLNALSMPGIDEK